MPRLRTRHPRRILKGTRKWEFRLHQDQDLSLVSTALRLVSILNRLLLVDHMHPNLVGCRGKVRRREWACRRRLLDLGNDFLPVLEDKARGRGSELRLLCRRSLCLPLLNTVSDLSVVLGE